MRQLTLAFMVSLAFVVVACGSGRPPDPTPNLEATVQARIEATVTYASSGATAVASATMAAAPSSADWRLSVQSRKTDRQGDYWVATGMVKNTGEFPVDNVVAVAMMSDVKNTVKTQGDALVDAKFLPPGQATSFKIYVPLNREISGSAVVYFTDIKGKPIPTYDEELVIWIVPVR